MLFNQNAYLTTIKMSDKVFNSFAAIFIKDNLIKCNTYYNTSENKEDQVHLLKFHYFRTFNLRTTPLFTGTMNVFPLSHSTVKSLLYIR